MKAVHRLSCFRSAGVSWAVVALVISSFSGPPGGTLSVSGGTLEPCPPPAGTLDESFFRSYIILPDPFESPGVATVIRELPNGKLMLGMFGNFSTGGTAPIKREILVRLNEDGTLDPSFVFTSTNFYRVWQTHALAVATNGLLAVATSGYGTDGFYHGQFHLLRSDGSVIVASATGGDNSTMVRAMAWQSDGRLLIGGNYASFLPGMPYYLARLFPASGTVDTSFTPPPNLGIVIGLAVDSSDRILVLAGDSILRLLPSGALDATFQPSRINPYVVVGDPGAPAPVLLDAQGRILVGGALLDANGQPRTLLTRLLPSGALDETFNPGSSAAKWWNGYKTICMALQPDGKILVGGSFAPFIGPARRGLVRLHGDGSVDPSFDIGTLFDAAQSIHLRRDGRILVTDALYNWGGSMAPYRLLADPQPRLAPPERLPPNSVRLRLDSVPGAEYVLQTSANLTSWRDVGTKRAEVCTLAFTNSPPAGAASFYRIRRPTESELGR